MVEPIYSSEESTIFYDFSVKDRIIDFEVKSMNNIMIEQIKGLLTEENMIAALANVSSCIMLNYKNLNWSGFYFK